VTILQLGKLVMERRGSEGLREFAKKLGVSPATLSRVENGKLPDLETFSKICDKLDLDPAEILQVGKKPAAHSKSTAASPMAVNVHFKADPHQDPEAAQDLAKLILAAQKHAAEME
jgi:transcriptional regulator with XRE-family HTH domain